MPNISVTTNLMGFYKPLDYQKWAKDLDFISWDCYPEPGDTPAETALQHDLMRGIKRQESFVLMEQTPSVTNWQPYNRLKRPGEMRLLSYQAGHMVRMQSSFSRYVDPLGHVRNSTVLSSTMQAEMTQGCSGRWNNLAMS